MNPIHQLILASIAMSSFSCTTIDGETRTFATAEEGVPGGEIVETSTITATVTGIDATKRKLTLVSPKGKKFSTVAGDQVANFDQIRMGDQLKATLTEEVVIRMAKPGEKLSDSSSLKTELPPKGSKPGITTIDSSQVIATVTAIDPKKRKATLSFSDGKSKKVKVRSDIDLTQLHVGDRVLMSVVETTAIKLEKP